MSDLGDVLELMYAAERKPLSVRARITSWQDPAGWAQAVVRWHSDTPGERVSIDDPRLANAAPPLEREVVSHRRPGRMWRVEREGGVLLRHDERWWIQRLDGGFMTNVRVDGTLDDGSSADFPSAELEMLFNPRAIPSFCDFLGVGGATYLDRDAYAVSGRLDVHRREPRRELFALGVPYANQLTLLLDAETGMLLKLETLADGDLFMRWQVEEIAFHQPMDDAFFVGPADAELLSTYSLARSFGSGWRGRLSRWFWTHA